MISIRTVSKQTKASRRLRRNSGAQIRIPKCVRRSESSDPSVASSPPTQSFLPETRRLRRPHNVHPRRIRPPNRYLQNLFYFQNIPFFYSYIRPIRWVAQLNLHNIFNLFFTNNHMVDWIFFELR